MEVAAKDEDDNEWKASRPPGMWLKPAEFHLQSGDNPIAPLGLRDRAIALHDELAEFVKENPDPLDKFREDNPSDYKAHMVFALTERE